MIKGIKFVGVPVSNQDAALKFWTEAVGMKVMTDQPFNEKQRWIEVKSPARKPGSRPSHRRATRTGSGSFSPSRSGPTTFSRPLRR